MDTLHRVKTYLSDKYECKRKNHKMQHNDQKKRKSFVHCSVADWQRMTYNK